MDEREPISASTALERAIIVVEEDYLAIYSNPEHPMSQLLDSRDPSLRPQAVTLYMQEAEALRALNPGTVTFDEIAQTRQPYEGEIERLYQRPSE